MARKIVVDRVVRMPGNGGYRVCSAEYLAAWNEVLFWDAEVADIDAGGRGKAFAAREALARASARAIHLLAAGHVDKAHHY